MYCGGCDVGTVWFAGWGYVSLVEATRRLDILQSSIQLFTEYTLLNYVGLWGWIYTDAVQSVMIHVAWDPVQGSIDAASGGQNG